MLTVHHIEILYIRLLKYRLCFKRTKYNDWLWEDSNGKGIVVSQSYGRLAHFFERHNIR